MDKMDTMDMFINDKIIPKILRNENCRLKSKSLEKFSNEDSFFITLMYKVKLNVIENVTEKETNLHLIVKVSKTDVPFVNAIKLDDMFTNEYIVYNDYFRMILRNNENIFTPKFIDGEINTGDVDYLVLENLIDYQMTKEHLFLNDDYVELAIKKLAKFHGLGYAFKENDPEAFKNIYSRFIETKFKNELKQPKYLLFLKSVLNRGFDYLPNNCTYSNAVINMYKKMFKDPWETIIELLRPKNQLAVVCHGDFNRNNIMFKHDPNTGRPIDVKFIDFQTVHYTSPTIDLGFFLAINVRYDKLAAHFDKWFALYHQIVLETIQENCIKEIDLTKYSYRNFLKDYANHAIYGYIITAFFAPIMEELGNDIMASVGVHDDNVPAEAVENFIKTHKFGSEKILIHTGNILKNCIHLYEKYCLDN